MHNIFDCAQKKGKTKKTKQKKKKKQNKTKKKKKTKQKEKAKGNKCFYMIARMFSSSCESFML